MMVFIIWPISVFVTNISDLDPLDIQLLALYELDNLISLLYILHLGINYKTFLNLNFALIVLVSFIFFYFCNS